MDKDMTQNVHACFCPFSAIQLCREPGSMQCSTFVSRWLRLIDMIQIAGNL